ncbi:MAG: TonB-dependent receptor plug domain-containing protein [Limnohabitans sp.]
MKTLKRIRLARPGAVLSAGMCAVLGVGAQTPEAVSGYPSVDVKAKLLEYRQFERIEITGSSILRKEQTQALPVQVVTRQDLERRGHHTLQEAVQSLTSVFNGRDLSQLGSSAGGYTNAALHGMPTGTLVLLNGKRLAPFGIQTNSGKENNGVDLDFLPLAAIDRIELLTDGASSLYGSDAIAGVINIITRTQTKGLEVTADVIRPQGGAAQSHVASMTWGQGRLANDGYSFRVTAELSQADALSVADRAFAGPGRKVFEHNGQSYLIDSPWVSPYSSPAWLYSPTTSRQAWSALYQDGACTGKGLSYGIAYPTTCRMNLQPTLDIYPSRESKRLHAQAEILLPNGSTFYSEIQHSQSKSQIAVTSWDRFGGRMLNKPGAPGYAEMLNNGMNPAVGFFFWQPDLPALAQSYENGQSRVVLGVKGEVNDWNYNASLYQTQSTVLKRAQVVNYAKAGLDLAAPALLAGMLQPLDAQNPLTEQLLNSRSWQTESEGKVSLTVLDFRASRSLMEIDGKDVLLGVGVDLQQENTETQYNPAVSSMPSFGAKRQNQAAYGELQVPVRPDWDVIAALRTDRYSDVGSTTNAKLASRWAINSQWALRGAVGTGFRAPSPGQTQVFGSNYYQSTLTQLMSCNSDLIAIAASLQPSAGSKQVICSNNATVRVFTNGNADLKPERSQQRTLGLAFTPQQNLSVGLDYWRVDMKDTLQFESWQEVLADPLKYRSAFVTDPKLWTNAGTTGSFNRMGLLLNVRNWGASVKEGLDVDVKYRQPGDWGRWLLGVQGTYLLQSKAKISPAAAWVSDLAAYSDVTGVASPRWRSKWMLGLESGKQHWQLNINRTSGYRDVDTTAVNLSSNNWETIKGRKVAGFTTVDVLGLVQLTPVTQLRVGISNVLNAVPALSFYSASNTVWGVNSQDGSLFGRSLQVGLTHRF